MPFGDLYPQGQNETPRFILPLYALKRFEQPIHELHAVDFKILFFYRTLFETKRFNLPRQFLNKLLNENF